MDVFKNALAGVVAIVALAALAVLLLVLYQDRGMSERDWNRSTYLFAAVEAIAFAAVGWLFGKEVHREQAENAEQRAETAQSAANVGVSMAHIIRTKQAANPEAFRLASPGQPSGDMAELTVLADRILGPEPRA